MNKEQIQEIEDFYEKLGISKDLPLQTTLVAHELNGFFSTRATVGTGNLFSNFSSQENK